MTFLSAKEMKEQTLRNLYNYVETEIDNAVNECDFKVTIARELPECIVNELKQNEYNVYYNGAITEISWNV